MSVLEASDSFIFRLAVADKSVVSGNLSDEDEVRNILIEEIRISVQRAKIRIQKGLDTIENEFKNL